MKQSSPFYKFWNKEFWKHPVIQFIKIISVPLLTVLVTTYFNYWLWKEQYTSSTKEKLLDYTLAAIHDFSEKGAMKISDHKKFLIMSFSVTKAHFLLAEKATIKQNRSVQSLTDSMLYKAKDSVYNYLKNHSPEYYVDVNTFEKNDISYFSSISYLYSFLPDSLGGRLAVFDSLVNPSDQMAENILFAYEQKYKTPLEKLDPILIASKYSDSVASVHGRLVVDLYNYVRSDENFFPSKELRK